MTPTRKNPGFPVKGGGAETGLPSELETRGDLTINYSKRLVTVAICQVQLVTTEYDVLCELAVKAGRVLTHEHLPHFVSHYR